MERSGAGPVIVPDAPPGIAHMRLVRTLLLQTCKNLLPSLSLHLKTLQTRMARSFSERGLLELGMLEGICTTLENKAQQERIRALYPVSGVFGTFAEGETATAMQQTPAHRAP